MERQEENQEAATSSESRPTSRDSLARIASALEKLSTEPEVEIEVGPPLCPWCGKLDPVVELPASSPGRGKLSQIILDMLCSECGRPFYVGVESYSTHQMKMTLVAEIEARRDSGIWNDDVR